MLNMDFAKTVVVETAAQEWSASPMPKVLRKPLAREDAERGHATSVVCYEPGASFYSHNHPGGEEILVLDGVFSDETGDFGEATYFRNPPGFVHAPFSRHGCLIFVKLHQFAEGDLTRVAIKTDQQKFLPEVDGIEKLPLHEFGSEQVSLIKVKSGTQVVIEDSRGVELFLLRGALRVAGVASDLRLFGWLRTPQKIVAHANQDTLLWLKTGHLGAVQD
ncbi:cupin domain-containing protein [Candidatus Pelagadaptatus aseana]|uniref:cupin domain-containing protein n=1 Tax=Candidatus Pelagadaptatus aseana TaxID=3120508 RepID=UPI003C6F434D